MMKHAATLGWLLTALLSAGAARAGQVAASCEKTCTISIGGRIDEGDDTLFHDLAAAHPTALVQVTGPGGRVAPALAIGREIHARGLRTLVPANASCASACSLIWLAGTRRALAPEARIGFHALSSIRPGQPPAETHAFDTAIVRYLTDLGYANDVTATIVNTPATLVHWRDAMELNANGIATQNSP